MYERRSLTEWENDPASYRYLLKTHKNGVKMKVKLFLINVVLPAITMLGLIATAKTNKKAFEVILKVMLNSQMIK